MSLDGNKWAIFSALVTWRHLISRFASVILKSKLTDIHAVAWNLLNVIFICTFWRFCPWPTLRQTRCWMSSWPLPWIIWPMHRNWQRFALFLKFVLYMTHVLLLTALRLRAWSSSLGWRGGRRVLQPEIRQRKRRPDSWVSYWSTSNKKIHV